MAMAMALALAMTIAMAMTMAMTMAMALPLAMALTMALLLVLLLRVVVAAAAAVVEVVGLGAVRAAVRWSLAGQGARRRVAGQPQAVSAAGLAVQRRPSRRSMGIEPAPGKF